MARVEKYEQQISRPPIIYPKRGFCCPKSAKPSEGELVLMRVHTTCEGAVSLPRRDASHTFDGVVKKNHVRLQRLDQVTMCVMVVKEQEVITDDRQS